MRVALRAVGEAGSRAAKVLLGERSLSALGVVGRRVTSADRRVSTIKDPTGWDVFVSDDPEDVHHHAARAVRAGVPVVLFGEEPATFDPDDRPDVPVVIGANPRSGLAAGLAAHECERHENLLEVVVGWTEPGRPARRGRVLSFPQPVGDCWSREGPAVWPEAPPNTIFLTAAIEGEWMGLMARVAAANTEGVEVRTLGVADHARYLDGIALAAAAVAVAGGAYPPGVQYPTAAADIYLDAALDAGLEVAKLTTRR